METFSSPPVSNSLSDVPKRGWMGLLSDPPAVPVWYAKSKSLPFLAGLLAAAIVAAFTLHLPYSRSLSWPALLGLAFERVLTVSFVCAVTVSVLSPSALHRNKAEFLALIRRSSLVALWLAPLTLFVRENSFLTVMVAATLAVFVVRSLEFSQDSTAPCDYSLLTSLRVDTLPLSLKFGLHTSVIAALCAQVAILSALGDHTILGALLIAMAFCIWTLSFNRIAPHPAWQRSPKTAKLAAPLLLLVVTSLTIIGLLPYLRRVHGSGHIASHHGLSPHRPSGGNSRQPSRASAIPRSDLQRTGGDGDNGIVLWGEKQSYTKLVAPTPILPNALANNGNANPLIIPFDGVYWFFKFPDVQPPSDSRQAHASPENVDIRSTDRRPLSIEAYDHLANLIDLDCCSRIQIAIRNADRYPETVSLELVLLNTTFPNHPFVSLGRATVNSTHPWNLYEKPAPISETLSFVIPARHSLKSFDEMKIVFLLDPARADAGAKIAIDHFVLIPRGL